jgi:hypothetical protein
MNYALLDKTGTCINVVNWDGHTDWDPPEGTVVAAIENPFINTVYKYDEKEKKWTPEIPVFLPVAQEVSSVCDYGLFWDNLIGSDVYKKIKQAAGINLKINLYCTEFISLLLTARISEPNKSAIQECIWALFYCLETENILNETDLKQAEILFKQFLFDRTNESSFYTFKKSE